MIEIIVKFIFWCIPRLYHDSDRPRMCFDFSRMNITEVNNFTTYTIPIFPEVEEDLIKLMKLAKLPNVPEIVFVPIYAFSIIGVSIPLLKFFRNASTSKNLTIKNSTWYCFILLLNYLWIPLSSRFCESTTLSNMSVFLYLWFVLDFTKSIIMIDTYRYLRQEFSGQQPPADSGRIKFAINCILSAAIPFMLFYGINLLPKKYASISYFDIIFVSRVLRLIFLVIAVFRTKIRKIDPDDTIDAEKAKNGLINGGFFLLITCTTFIPNLIYTTSRVVLHQASLYFDVANIVPVGIMMWTELAVLFADGICIGIVMFLDLVLLTLRSRSRRRNVLVNYQRQKPTEKIDVISAEISKDNSGTYDHKPILSPSAIIVSEN